MRHGKVFRLGCLGLAGRGYCGAFDTGSDYGHVGARLFRIIKAKQGINSPVNPCNRGRGSDELTRKEGKADCGKGLGAI